MTTPCTQKDFIERICLSVDRIEEAQQKILVAFESHLAYHKGQEEARKIMIETTSNSSVRWGSVASWLAILASVSMAAVALIWR